MTLIDEDIPPSNSSEHGGTRSHPAASYSRAARLHAPDLVHAQTARLDPRSPARRDRDRILYSPAFRRLSDVTQVVAPTERYPIHNRLTHSLKVAQIGRSLAETLLAEPGAAERAAAAGGLDPDVVEAAALAHDLGHPPFGHVAERELDDILTRQHGLADGFEGNAQSFRVVTTLAVRHEDVPGLDLTRATLGAILKYPWVRTGSGPAARKWGAYASEAAQLAWARQGCPLPDDQPTLEAAVMDWADDVTYAVHDVEDFFQAGLLPLDRLVTDPAERDRFLAAEVARLAGQGGPGSQEGRTAFSAADLETAFHGLMAMVPISGPYRGVRSDRAALRAFASTLIDRFLAATSLPDDPGGPGGPLAIEPRARMEVLMLKGLTWYYVIASQALLSQRFGQRRLVRSVFDMLLAASEHPGDWPIFPPIDQDTLAALDPADRPARVRLVADVIASMSEPQAIDIHARLTGRAPGLDPTVVIP